jgi:hypothetical protein
MTVRFTVPGGTTIVMVGAEQDMLMLVSMQLMFMDPEPIDPEPITAVAIEAGAIPMPPPPQAVRAASRAVAEYSDAGGSALRAGGAIDIRGPPLLSKVSVRRERQ